MICIKYFYFIIISLFIINFNFLNAQNFNRIEVVAGLSQLEENNGVALADYNGDGYLDIFVVALGKDTNGVAKSHSRLFKNKNNGTFEDVTESAGLLQDLFPFNMDGTTYDKALEGVKYGAFWGDYDNDGYPDLLMTNVYRVYLFHNKGDGTFEDVTTQTGITKDNSCINTGATWFDFDKDGFLDLYISDWNACPEGNSFYRNNGDGTFDNASYLFGNLENKNSLMSIPFDFNNDGWMDLYVANDVINDPNHLFINQKGTGFIEEASKYGLDHARNDMGIAFGDYNNDGFFDMYITDRIINPLLTNRGDNTFFDLAQEQGVISGGWSWDTVFADFDLDGDEDLFVVNGFEYKGHSTERNIYFENLHGNGESKFIDRSDKANLGYLAISVGAGVFDFDNDGDLDIFLTNADRSSFFYENKTTDFTMPAYDLNWSKVNLEGTISNRDAIGTKIVLKSDKNTLYRYYTGKGFLSQSLKSVHFGLNNATKIKELEITWPSGIIETFYNLPINKTLNFKEGSNYMISNIGPTAKIYGCTDPTSCNYNPYATTSSGECVYLKATSTIYGNSSVYELEEESYSYSPSNGATLSWTVEGGEIIEGDNSTRLTVKWGSGNLGRVTVVEHNVYCSSKELELVVDIRKENSIDPAISEKSIARLWNEVLLEAIRKDYARPTVHARNLFHTSIAMYDAWAIYDKEAHTYLVGNEVNGFSSDFHGFKTTQNLEEARLKTISYAAYRLLQYRFRNSPNSTLTMDSFDELMRELGYDTDEFSIDYSTGDPIALGNYIAETIIEYGKTDGSNEIEFYKNKYYAPVNSPLLLNNPDQSEILSIDPNRWQPLSFDTFIDQSGNLIEGLTPSFLNPEWGNVKPFNFKDSDKTTYSRSGHDYVVYLDPKEPPLLDLTGSTRASEAYKWNFSLVSIWSSHLDPYDSVMWDISPKSIGRIDFDRLPNRFEEYKYFYKEIDGGDISLGHDINPITNQPYQEQIVPRGDYTRVLAEFWADGPDSETPPGHWFTILNYVSDQKQLVKRFNGQGRVLSNVEWDIKSYFILGGALHDAAIAAWSIKGWYDYIRPISAIRFMAEKGQSTDFSMENYDNAGIPLKEGYVEIIKEGDPLIGPENENLNKIKLFAWRGHDFIKDSNEDEAGVGWILAENWWPYQRPSFVTPPFAGYVSGHSTFSRAAAEVLTLITGSEYFPGGLGEFIAKKNEFLVFEKGPSIDVRLQWATYKDASDQCSLSRIWGGIHPPADDIPGRRIGESIGKKAFCFGQEFFQEKVESNGSEYIVYPNPLSISLSDLYITNTENNDVFTLYDMAGRSIKEIAKEYSSSLQTTILKLPSRINTGIYILKINNDIKKIAIRKE